jgi:hypothetical protein
MGWRDTSAKWLGTSLGVLKATPKIVGISALIGGAAVAVPLIANSMRNSRRADPDDLPPPPELTAPIPPVLDFTPQMPSEPQTLMGMDRVEGDFAKKVKNQRGGVNAIDTSAPSIMRPDGRNAIDGSQSVEDLGMPAGRSM